jgi:archaemetzincin
LATKLGKPRPGEWLAEHHESGQTFAEYFHADPVRRNKQLSRMYICQVGAFSDEQKKILELTREYMSLFFDVPVTVTKAVPLTDIPADARRTHPSWGDKQILTGYVLDKLLQPERPDDALAYLAFTSSDLWPGAGWNFVFGQANLRERVGVWSIYRNGDPAKDKEEFQLCLRRTMSTATHETGHILTIQHCIAFDCNMNGSNNRVESDSRPLHFCPVCLRKLCWNLQLEPVGYLEKLQAFCRKHGLDDEVEWYGKAIQALKAKTDS